METGVKFFDSLINLVTGLGGESDKTTHIEYQTFQPLNQSQLENAYRGDWVSRKIVAIPAKDATREWRTWDCSSEQAKAIHEVERKLKIKHKVLNCLIQARLYGGAGMVIGIRGQDPSRELNYDTIGKDSLEFVHNTPRQHLSETEQIIWDPSSPYFGKPEKYHFANYDVQYEIHSSRVAEFIPSPYPDPILQAQIWGDSVLDTVDTAIKQFLSTTQATASYVQEAKVDVLKIPNMLENIATERYRTKLMQRLSMTNRGKSLFSTMMIDGKDELSRMHAVWAGLPDIIKIYITIACGAADIPVTRMFNQSPTGLTATGEMDLVNYYDSVADFQKNDFESWMKPLDEAIVRSALGTYPEGLKYKWNPLWQMSEMDRVKTNSIEASMFKIDVTSGIFNKELLYKMRVEQLKRNETYPGFEEIEEEFGEMPIEEELPEEDEEELPENEDDSDDEGDDEGE